MVFGFSIFSRSLGTDDLIRSSKELEKITQEIQKINKKDTFLDKIISSKHLLVIYASYMAFVFMKIYDKKYKYVIIISCLLLILFFQFYLIKPFVNWVHLKRLTKLRKRHEYIINTLKDRSKFENINYIINRFTSGEDKDQDYKQILDDDIKERLVKLDSLNTEVTERQDKINALDKKNSKNKKNMLKRFIDNVEDNDDEIIHSLVVNEVFDDLLVRYEFVCKSCKNTTSYYIKKEDIVDNQKELKVEVEHCLKC